MFLIVGHSGSGKTEIVKRLESLGYRVLQSYTTRPARSVNEWGHLFCTIDEYNKLKSTDEIVAYSYFDENHYFSTKQQLYDTDLYVVDPDGINDLKMNIDDIEFVTIYLKVELITRIERMKSRGDSEEKIRQRLNVDGRKFSNLAFDYAVSNRNFDKAVNIIKYIMETENEKKNCL